MPEEVQRLSGAARFTIRQPGEIMIGRADQALLECGKLLSCLDTFALRPALFNRLTLDAAARMHQFDHERETDVLALWRCVLDSRVGVG